MNQGGGPWGVTGLINAAEAEPPGRHRENGKPSMTVTDVTNPEFNVKRKRAAISKKTRFAIMRRDQFKCQYCGASAPSVKLHVDHIHPVSGGGGNDLTNLITACIDCNAGKGSRFLDRDRKNEWLLSHAHFDCWDEVPEPARELFQCVGYKISQIDGWSVGLVLDALPLLGREEVLDTMFDSHSFAKRWVQASTMGVGALFHYILRAKIDIAISVEGEP